MPNNTEYKNWEPVEGEEVLTYDMQLGKDIRVVYLEKVIGEDKHMVKTSSGRPWRVNSVRPKLTEPEVQFQTGELVWVKLSRRYATYQARYYAEYAEGFHRVFGDQHTGGRSYEVVEIHKFDKRPF